MIFGQDRNELRQMYADAWQKHVAQSPLTPLEAQIVDVVANHPEYHDAVAGNIDTDYTPDGGQTNPFLHMGLHLGIQEQIATDRPSGIRRIFEALAANTGGTHEAEHQMIDCLAETLWEAQRQNGAPDEGLYMERLRRLSRV